jgi:hypothetical protein
VVLVGYLYFNSQSKIQGLVDEKEQMRNSLQTELDSLLYQHNRVKGEYGRLSDSLFMKDSVIMANAEEIKQLLNYKFEYFQIKKKLDRLREVAQGYVLQLDSLYTVNQELKDENERIRENYRTEKNKNTELLEDKKELEQIVTKASVLRAYNIQATGIRQRGSKQIETDKAARADRVRVCFTLGENTLVEPGKKTLYLRIARPDKVILTYDETDEYTFMYQGVKVQYSIKRDVEYKGEAMDICVYWNRRNTEEDAMSGRYHVMIYSESEIIGESYFELK